MERGRLKQSPTLGPLLRLVEDYRMCADVPAAILASTIGVSRLTYYWWLVEKTKPSVHNVKMCKLVGAAMKRAYENQDLPVPKTMGLTKRDREAKIKEVLDSYVESFSVGAN